MTRPDEAVEAFKSGLACSQAVLTAFAPPLGMDQTEALRIAVGFGSGMRMGETCGAVTGAMMALGLALTEEECATIEGRSRSNEMVRELHTRFIDRHGTVRCCDLLGCNPSTPEGHQQAITEGLFRSRCPKFVEDASLIVEEMLSEETLY